jgi:RNA polymerase sigma-70 factor (sigma-E family)
MLEVSMTPTMTRAAARSRAEGEGRGLADLYVRYAPGAIRLAFVLTGDRELAQDLAHDAFVRVSGRFGHLRFPEAFDAYLRRTVVNLATSVHRRRRIERAYLEREEGLGGRVHDVPPDVGRREELRRALRRLPVRQRAAVVLRYYEDLSERQVAETLGCSVAAARSLVARAMESLRGEIRGEEA